MFFASEAANAQVGSTQEKIGDVAKYGIPALALGSTLIWKDEDNATLDCLKTLAVTYGTVYSLKRIINKPRPNGEEYAFPSGHTSSAFAGAAYIHRRYGWQYGLPTYLLAGYTGYTRVEAQQHDYWDVLAGAVIGIGSAYIFTNKYDKPNVDVSFSKSANGFYFKCIVPFS